jgi:2-dehydro-3-deoxyphosphogalactonate aldolase|tara:strand:+ start:4993 stop:5592 length:600 start_codon:yes stop_codon:yes gene_type:complete
MNRNIIAILRGVKPKEVLDIAHVIVKAGISQVEVPLNSPSAFESIELLRDEFEGSIQFGAGTVTDIKQVEVLAKIGVNFIVSPNFDPVVVKATKKADILSYPGVITPTECFSALNCGADGLKFFPASLIGENNLIALKAVLPSNIPLFMVGGVGPKNFASWIKAGATGFGIGSGLYKAGDSSEIVGKKAESIVLSYDEA